MGVPKSEVISVGEEAEEYLKIKSKSTAEIYRTAYRKFIKSYRKRHGEDTGFGHFLDKIFENLKLPHRDQKRVAEMELVDFIDDLLKDGVSNNTIRLYFTAVQNFLKYKHVVVSATFVGNFPKSIPKKVNHKHEWKLSQIREFVDKATTFRDKAIILTLFQSGMGINELCELNYGDIRVELEEENLPLLLNIVRQKNGLPYKTFLGTDAIKYLNLYLETRRDLRDNSPLFVKQGTDDVRITVGLVQASFREIAKELSFIKKRGEGYNPARPHSLRTAFRSRLTGKMHGDLIEFFMGHKLPESKRTYMNIPSDELREMYAQFEHLLSIETTSQNVLAEREGKVSKIDMVAKKRIEELETKIINMELELEELKEILETYHSDYIEAEEERRKTYAELVGARPMTEEEHRIFIAIRNEVQKKFKEEWEKLNKDQRRA